MNELRELVNQAASLRSINAVSRWCKKKTLKSRQMLTVIMLTGSASDEDMAAVWLDLMHVELARRGVMQACHGALCMLPCSTQAGCVLLALAVWYREACWVV